MTRRRAPTMLVPALCAALGAAGCGSTPAPPAPETPAPATKAADDDPLASLLALTAPELAARMVDAHGGQQRWRDLKTVHYQHTLVAPMPGPPWVSIETVELPSGRAYHEWPEHEASMAYDGREVWSLDWKVGNKPKMMVWLSLSALIAPWLVYAEAARLEGPARARLPGTDEELVTLTVVIDEPEPAPPHADYHRLFIDPETLRIRGLEYAVSFGPMLDGMGLPPDVEAFGPMTHIYTEYATVDGLVVPAAYHTIGPDGKTVAGRHTVTKWAIGGPFDEARLVKPPGAVVDTSTRARRAASG